MHCTRVQESLLDYHGGHLSSAEVSAVRDHLKTCLTCQREWSTLQETLLKLDRLEVPAPSERMRANFYTMLETCQRDAEARSPFDLMRSRIDRFFAALLPARPALQFALACAVLAAGLFAGARFLRPAGPAALAGPDPATQRELADLRAQVETLSRVMTTTLLQQQSQPGADRLRTALAALRDPSSDEGQLAELLSTLAFDPSTNVRLTALEALYAHADQAAVRAGVLASLPREPSPLVQVAMIDFLAAAREPQAASAFEAMMRDETLHEAVRAAARRALVQL